MLNISFNKKQLLETDAIALIVRNRESELINQLDNHLSTKISHLLQEKDISNFSIPFNGKLKHIIILEYQEISKSYQIEEIGGEIYSSAKKLKCKDVEIIFDTLEQFSSSEISSLLASGALLKSYTFDKYFTQERDKFDVEKLLIVTNEEEKSYNLLKEKRAILDGVFLARDLVSEVPNILYPKTYAEKILQEFKSLAEIEIIDEKNMQELGMGALLGVAQGSINKPKLVVIKYNGANNDSKPICLVGKGVTFDTGGISLKPSGNMGDMKYDMAGSAAVVGAIKSLAKQKAKINIVGVVGLAENMPGGNAQRPGDVVKTMSGKTVEILNTDAEGRLVLADCVTYIQKTFDPECIVDLATLTGAILISLAGTYAGCFANDDKLANKLISSSNDVNEKLWRMPLHKDYNDMLKSPVADMANIGGDRGMAGSSTAAHFIERFIEKDTRWAHLDIAGTAWIKNDKNPICPKGAVGFGVRLLNKFIQNYYKS